MERHATSVTQLFPVSAKGNTTYVVEHYEVDKQCRVPNYGLEKVVGIRLVSSWQPHVEVEFQDYGEIWITSHVIEIRFENADYVEVRNARLAKKKEEETKRE